MTVPQSRVCHYYISYVCSIWRDVNRSLTADDLHRTTFEQNFEWSLFFIQFVEISFIETTEIVFEGFDRFTNGNSLNVQVLSKFTYWIQRVLNSSYFDIVTSSANITFSNDCLMYQCAYCEMGVCYACFIEYELIGGVCVYCASDFLYDPVSKMCYPQIDTTSDFTGLIPIINSLALTNIVIINYLFEAAGMWSSEQFTVYFNSIESTNYNPLLRTYYTSSEIALETTHLYDLFFKHLNDVSRFVSVQNIKINYAVADPATYLIQNPDLIWGPNNCHSPQLKWEATTIHLGNCVSYCLIGYYYDVQNTLCRPCPETCLECVSQLLCTSCPESRILDEGACILHKRKRYSQAPAHSDNWDQYLLITQDSRNRESEIDLSDIICSHGHFSDKGKCSPCSRGCIVCNGGNVCQVCNANFQKNSAGECKAIDEIVEKLTAAEIQAATDKSITNNFNCKLCSGLGDEFKACELCLPECRCSVSDAKEAMKTLIFCEGIVFDKEFLLGVYSNSQYYISSVVDESTLTIVSKEQNRKFEFKVDPVMVRKTNNCFLKANISFEITSSSTDRASSIPNISPVASSVISSTRNYVVPISGIVGLQISGPMVYIIQFNKAYLFLSLSKERVGGIFEYINYNLHQNKKFELPFPVSKQNKFLYEYEYNKMSGSKLISEDDIMRYLQIIIGTAILWIIALILPRCSDSEKNCKIICLSH
jgi:hypothetical protein